ncbi:hypothetical protein EVAR_83438_1 [Eumeta japonica]|uniref:Uncharacterized protein n=1 Tax=Eumeta variegata TaxID=151549 RepID=A0A4C1TYJ5_EUMVA|nr:hypothetical protein EVAR_83438_1 [Eumeta japonica]
MNRYGRIDKGHPKKSNAEDRLRCGWESLYENVTLGNVTMSHRTRERPAECLASLPLNYDRSARAALEN